MYREDMRQDLIDVARLKRKAIIVSDRRAIYLQDYTIPRDDYRVKLDKSILIIDGSGVVRKG